MKPKPGRQTLFRLFWIFFKAGSFTFAGGLAMLPLIQKDVIDKYEMLDKDTFLDYAALSQTLPGIIALNCGIFVGRSVAGVAGAFAAGFGVILPAFIAMLAATILLNSLPRTDIVENIFAGVRSASAALILYSAISLGKKNYRKLFPIALIAISFVLTLFFKVSAYLIVIGAALAGLAYMTMKNKSGENKTGEGNTTAGKTGEGNTAAGKTGEAKTGATESEQK